MKDFLDFMCGLNLTPTEGVLSVLLCTAFNVSVRFATLYGVVFVVVKAVQTALS